MTDRRDKIDPAPFLAAAAALHAGDPEAAERLARALRPILLRTAEEYLGQDHPDVDDVVQDAILSTLRYLAADGGFQGDPIRLTMTIARNRCRDLHRRRASKPQVEISSMQDWLAAETASPLDEMENAQRTVLLQEALNAISDACKRLLHAMYIVSRPTEDLRRELNLGTVQAVYYRRSVCIEEMRKFLHAPREVRSWSGRVGSTRINSGRKGR